MPTRLFRERIAAQFEGDYKLHFHLAPPAVVARRPGHRPDREEAVRPVDDDARSACWRRLKWLRGTAFDPFAAVGGPQARARA